MRAPLRHAIEVATKASTIGVLRWRVGPRPWSMPFAKYPGFDEQTAGFTYARLEDAVEEEETGYSATALDAWAAKARDWAQGGRDVFVFMINGAKVRAPAAAQALIARLEG